MLGGLPCLRRLASGPPNDAPFGPPTNWTGSRRCRQWLGLSTSGRSLANPPKPFLLFLDHSLQNPLAKLELLLFGFQLVALRILILQGSLDIFVAAFDVNFLAQELDHHLEHSLPRFSNASWSMQCPHCLHRLPTGWHRLPALSKAAHQNRLLS